MTDRTRLLVVEDSEDDALLLIRELARHGMDPQWRRVDAAGALREALASQEWDAVVADYHVPGLLAPQALELVHEAGRDIPFLVVSGSVGEEIHRAEGRGMTSSSTTEPAEPP